MQLPSGFSDGDVKAAVDGLMQVLDKVQVMLHLGSTDKGHGGNLPELLATDIRVLFYLTALLREASCKPLDSPFLRVTRSTAYFEVLHSCINLSLARFQREAKGPPPRDLCANKLKGGPTDSPLSQFMDDFDLGLIFEHLIVCLRHTLVQAMYIAPEVSTKLLPWAWVSQERLPMHKDIMNWLPQIVKRYKHISAIRTETLRYFACAASYECAPFARPEDITIEAVEDDDRSVTDSPMASPTAHGDAGDAADPGAGAAEVPTGPAGPAAAGPTAGPEREALHDSSTETPVDPAIRLPFGGLISLRQKELRNFLAEELERSEDMYSLCLAMLCVANFAAYERRVLEGPTSKKLGKHLPVEEMSRLLRGVVKVLKQIPSFDDWDVANTMTLHALRFICTLVECRTSVPSIRRFCFC